MSISAPVQVAYFPTTSGGVSQPTTLDCPAGNTAIALVYPDTTNGTVTNFQDSVGNTYVKAIATSTQTGQFTGSIWVCENNLHIPVGSTFTASGSPSSLDMTICYVSGATGGIDIAVSTVVNSNVTTLTLASGTLACAAEILIGFVIPANSAPPPTATGFTNYDGAYGFYKIVSSTSSVNFSPTWTGSAHAVAVLISIEISPVSGTAAWTEAQDSVAGAGTVGSGITGTAAWTEAQDALTGAGGVVVDGSGAWTEARDAIAASGGAVIDGTSAWTEAQDSVAGSGTVAASIMGSAAWVEGQDSVSAAGSVDIAGSAAIVEAQDIFAGSGSVSLPAITGSAAWTEVQDAFSASGVNGIIDGEWPLTRKQRQHLREKNQKRQQQIEAAWAQRTAEKQELRDQISLAAGFKVETLQVAMTEPDSDEDEDADLEMILLYH